MFALLFAPYYAAPGYASKRGWSHTLPFYTQVFPHCMPVRSLVVVSSHAVCSACTHMSMCLASRPRLVHCHICLPTIIGVVGGAEQAERTRRLRSSTVLTASECSSWQQVISCLSYICINYACQRTSWAHAISTCPCCDCRFSLSWGVALELLFLFFLIMCLHATFFALFLPLPLQSCTPQTSSRFSFLMLPPLPLLFLSLCAHSLFFWLWSCSHSCYNVCFCTACFLVVRAPPTPPCSVTAQLFRLFFCLHFLYRNQEDMVGYVLP